MWQNFHRRVVVACSLVLAIQGAAAPSISRVDDSGRLDRLSVGAGWAHVGTDVRIYAKGWSRSVSLSSTRDVKVSTNSTSRVWTGSLAPNGPDGPQVHVAQAVRIDPAGKVHFNVTATGLREGDIEGVMFLLNFPAEAFAGGSLMPGKDTVPLPETLPQNIYLWNGKVGTMVFANPFKTTRVTVEASPSLSVTVQDGRKWAREFTAMIYLHRGNLPKGQTVEATVTLAADGQVDQTPAVASVDASKVKYKVAGIGGNYCFNIESPVTKHTLEHLQVRAARTEMSLKLWAPKQMSNGTASMDYQPYAVADTPGSRIRRELELMQVIERKEIPYSISVWRMPPWLGELMSRSDRQERWRITPSHWPGVLQAIGTYLLYAKDKYQVEPDYFSFNESNYGVDVFMTPEEHCDAIKRLGAHFEKLGLRTKLLLGDVAGPRDTHTYAEPAARDPEAMKYVGAVSFHSWGGAEPRQYAAWGDLAERLRLPLIVAEAGPDSAAWQTGAYRSFPYAVREMVHYQELLLHARAQSILLWEFTGDYSLFAGARPDPEGRLMTERFCLQKHWCDLIPPGSEAVATQCETDGVLVTAFRSGRDLTIHISNAKWERPITISGLPTVKQLKTVRTAQGEYFKNLGVTSVTGGKVSLTLPAESLTTLTTLKFEDAVPMR